MADGTSTKVLMMATGELMVVRSSIGGIGRPECATMNMSRDDKAEVDILGDIGAILYPRHRSSLPRVAAPFPFKLHVMLADAVKQGHESIVSWVDNGRCFRVHKPDQFMAIIMQKYFRQSQFASFQKQLNIYGFQRLKEGRNKGSYYHKCFVKGRVDLCHFIIREKIDKGTRRVRFRHDLELDQNTKNEEEGDGETPKEQRRQWPQQQGEFLVAAITPPATQEEGKTSVLPTVTASNKVTTTNPARPVKVETHILPEPHGQLPPTQSTSAQALDALSANYYAHKPTNDMVVKPPEEPAQVIKPPEESVHTPPATQEEGKTTSVLPTVTAAPSLTTTNPRRQDNVEAHILQEPHWQLPPTQSTSTQALGALSNGMVIKTPEEPAQLMKLSPAPRKSQAKEIKVGDVLSLWGFPFRYLPGDLNSKNL